MGDARRVERFVEAMAHEPLADDGRMHPNTLLNAVNEWIEPTTIVIVDGGDVLSFARTGLRTPTYLDLGPFGCLGVGTPFAVSAALNFPSRRVIAVIGDGAFGFNAMEVETAVREDAKVVLVIANNRAFNIERYDQVLNYGGRIVRHRALRLRIRRPRACARRLRRTCRAARGPAGRARASARERSGGARRLRYARRNLRRFAERARARPATSSARRLGPCRARLGLATTTT